MVLVDCGLLPTIASEGQGRDRSSKERIGAPFLGAPIPSLASSSRRRHSLEGKWDSKEWKQRDEENMVALRPSATNLEVRIDTLKNLKEGGPWPDQPMGETCTTPEESARKVKSRQA